MCAFLCAFWPKYVHICALFENFWCAHFCAPFGQNMCAFEFSIIRHCGRVPPGPKALNFNHFFFRTMWCPADMILSKWELPEILEDQCAPDLALPVATSADVISTNDSAEWLALSMVAHVTMFLCPVGSLFWLFYSWFRAKRLTTELSLGSSWTV